MKYLSGKPFSVGGAGSRAYAEGWERIFGKNRQAAPEETKPAPVAVLKFPPRKRSGFCYTLNHSLCTGLRGADRAQCECACHDAKEGL